ncbi:unnamed protein product [Bursaphelenchus xylophilus]|uniref:(pine wood nematode) hypothetical protein n=1 Tax=Bursaphelenchus xylophilus TaxID=6326 RepID=A0A1I7SUL9_BURXY|nr:unnamed protein product [Bursaphelenchus xylophilus]CAG9118576.1 unnamed protein product [Bursaphelenchus xylophilus]
MGRLGEGLITRNNKIGLVLGLRITFLEVLTKSPPSLRRASADLPMDLPDPCCGLNMREEVSIIIKDYVHDGFNTNCCCICGAEAFGLHFGVMACRACAAFFRRSVAMGKTYKCKQKQNCPIHKDSRNMCRACRYRKCEKLGMKKDNIQFYREPFGQRRLKPRPTQDTEQTALMSMEMLIEEPRPTTSNQSLLSKMAEGYRTFHANQKSLFFALYPETMFEDPNTVWREVPIVEHVRFERSSIPLLLTMLKEYFPPFSEFSKPQMADTLRHFSFFFGRVDQAYWTSQYFPDLADKRIVLHFGQYVNVENMERFYKDDKNPKQSERFFMPITKRCVAYTQKYKALQVDLVETAGIVGAALWREAMLHADFEISLAPLQQLLRELHEYCRKTYPNNESRFGILMLMLRDVEELILTLQEAVTIGRLSNDHYRHALEDIQMVRSVKS